jgi:hypothetical protein
VAASGQAYLVAKGLVLAGQRPSIATDPPTVAS